MTDEAIAVADKHRASHAEGETCWQCATRETTTFWNHFLALVEDPERRCLWCDGTGWHLYATPYGTSHNEFRPCVTCNATGAKNV